MVLVIIGLLVGGILTGRDLIDTAAQRAQVTQIQRYNTAVRTFQLKYGYLPGDIPAPYATQFGFQARGTQAGEGDGNGLIESYNAADSVTCGYWEANGETLVFWMDLSTAGLIDGGFSTASETNTPASNVTETSTPALSAYFPHAKKARMASLS